MTDHREAKEHQEIDADEGNDDPELLGEHDTDSTTENIGTMVKLATTGQTNNQIIEVLAVVDSGATNNFISHNTYQRLDLIWLS